MVADGQQQPERGAAPEPEQQVAVAYETARSGDLRVEKGTVQEASPFQQRALQDDAVCVRVERDAGIVYLRVPVHGGTVDALHHATARHDARQGSLVDLVDTSGVAGSICMDCREWLDHFSPVNTGHGTTGDSGCPYCLAAAPVRSVVHEVGDERSVTGGYVPDGSRGHGDQVTLAAAKAIVNE
jgi:hypothetical protein